MGWIIGGVLVLLVGFFAWVLCRASAMAGEMAERMEDRGDGVRLSK